MGERDFHPKDIKRLKAAWNDYLQQHSLNSTQQRELIVDQFLRCRDHVSIEQLLARVRKRNRKVGYATVYRTLKLLAEAGLASQIEFGEGQTRYEVAGEHHDHFICTSCGLILEFEDPQIERLQEEVAQRLGGFVITRHRHELYGICAKKRGIPEGHCPNEDRK